MALETFILTHGVSLAGCLSGGRTGADCHSANNFYLMTYC